MSRIQAGTRVSVDFSKAPKHYGMPSGASSSKIYNGVMGEDDAIIFDDEVGGWGKDGRHWHCPEQCITAQDVYLIPVSSMKRIYDVACDSWKGKLSSMVGAFDEHFVCSKDFAKQMIDASTSEQKIVVIEVLTEAGYKSKKDEKLKYFLFECKETDQYSEKHYPLSKRTEQPIYVRDGLASSSDMELRELGFGYGFKTILVDELGNETVLSDNHYLKFKIK